ncbi:hypothetical protein AGJ34_20435 [Cronobacter dublinensis subsp. dublinensis]|nr:hypothetical protein [Cronobacter dublinensis subsp. dublinensis]EGT5729674.1 hypothetical protein [Cronobacter dublinensis subsp. dublinensis]
MNTIDSMGWIILYIMTFTSLFGGFAELCKVLINKYPSKLKPGTLGFLILIVVSISASFILTPTVAGLIARFSQYFLH